jgi:hypothetical protein
MEERIDLGDLYWFVMAVGCRCEVYCGDETARGAGMVGSEVSLL